MTTLPFHLEKEQHHRLGVALFNLCWPLLEKEELSSKEQERLEHLALGSMYHWQRSPHFQPLNDQRGRWMLSRVYAVLGKGESALTYAEQCWALTEELGLSDFDRSYALEAIARALAAAGRDEEAERAKKTASDSSQGIEGPKDRELFLADLHAGPWFGLSDKASPMPGADS